MTNEEIIKELQDALDGIDDILHGTKKQTTTSQEVIDHIEKARDALKNQQPPIDLG